MRNTTTTTTTLALASMDKRAARFYTERVFAIPLDTSLELMDQYYLLYHQGSHIIAQSKNQCGYYQNANGFRYKIVYKYPLTRGHIHANMSAQYAMSFRAPYECYGIEPMVIIALTHKVITTKLELELETNHV